MGALRRVITPVAALRNTHLTNLLGYHSGALVGSRADLLRLGALFRLAAVSRHSAVFLPLRDNRPIVSTDPSADGAGLVDGRGLVDGAGLVDGQAPTDLVVARCETPLRPSAWPGIRERMRHGPGPGTPSTMLAPAPRPMTSAGTRDSARNGTRDRTRDGRRWRLSVAEHAHTLFMSGTAGALFDAGDELTWCGEAVASNRDIRRHGGPVLLGQLDGPDRQLGRHTTTWECMILAEDPIFHRARWTAQRTRPENQPGRDRRR